MPERMPDNQPDNASEKATTLAGVLNRISDEFNRGEETEGLRLAYTLAPGDVSETGALDHLSGLAAGVGMMDLAADFCSKALEKSPDDPVMRVKFALLLHHLKRIEDARREFDTIASQFGPEGSLALAAECRRIGKAAASELFLKTMLQSFPDHVDARLLLWRWFREEGRTSEALGQLEKALEADPASPRALFEFGTLLLENGRYDRALDSYKKALASAPDRADLHYLAGNACVGLGDLDTAIDYFKNAVRLKPDFPEAHNNIGNINLRHGRLAQAETAYLKALEVRPEYAEAMYNLGNLYYMHLSNLTRAEQWYRKALAINPDYAAAVNNLGNTLMNLGRLDEAYGCFEKAAALKPDFAEAHHNMGNLLLLRSTRLEEAMACFRKALEARPDYTDACVALIDALSQTCGWDELEKWRVKLAAMSQKDQAAGRHTSENPLLSLRLDDDPEQNLLVAKAYTRRMQSSLPKQPPEFRHSDRIATKGRLTIGYLSSDFNNHPVTHCLAGVFGLHDRDSFRVFAYSNGDDDGSGYRDRIKRDCDKFTDLTDMDVTERARTIFRDGVDILVDLTGHTKAGMLNVCALRPAPVQVSYLGFLGSTGSDFMDYTITDKVVTPPDHAQWYTEEFVYLPHCYQANDNRMAISEHVFRRSDFDLPETGFVFCSFNEPYKIEKKMFFRWMNILKRCPGSVIWLLEKSGRARENLVLAAESMSVDPKRLVFSKRIPLEEHLARLKLADLALDTLTYNGGATTSNALWAGVPVLTTPGRHFVARMTASALQAVDLPELIADSLDDYENTAVDLASNPTRLDEFKRRLMDDPDQKPLFDTERFTRELERVFRGIWDNYLEDKDFQPSSC